MAMSNFENGMNVARTQDGRNIFVNAAFLAKLLDRSLPFLITEKYAQTYAMPVNSGMSMKFRRYESLSYTPFELMEGVTPNGQKIEYTDLVVDLHQYGDFVILTDVLLDTNDTRVKEEVSRLVSEQATYVVENLRLATLLAGTNVEYANGAARADVNTPINNALITRVLRNLRRQLAMPLTEVIASKANFYTENVLPSYVCFVHSDLDQDIRNMTGFKDAVDYGTQMPWPNEIGNVQGVRFVYTTFMPTYPDAGGAATNTAGDTMLSTSGTNADVYPCIFVAKDAYGIVPLKGKDSLSLVVVPNTPSHSDPLGQRMSIGWKTIQASVILNQDWLIRGEVAVTAF